MYKTAINLELSEKPFLLIVVIFIDSEWASAPEQVVNGKLRLHTTLNLGPIRNQKTSRWYKFWLRIPERVRLCLN